MPKFVYDINRIAQDSFIAYLRHDFGDISKIQISSGLSKTNCAAVRVSLCSSSVIKFVHIKFRSTLFNSIIKFVLGCPLIVRKNRKVREGFFKFLGIVHIHLQFDRWRKNENRPNGWVFQKGWEAIISKHQKYIGTLWCDFM